MASNVKKQFLSTRDTLNKLISKYNQDGKMPDLELVRHVQTMNEQVYSTINSDMDVIDKQSSGHTMLFIINQMNKRFIQLLTEINTDNSINIIYTDKPMENQINTITTDERPNLQNISINISKRLSNLADLYLDSPMTTINKEKDVIKTDSILKMTTTIFMILFTLTAFWFNRNTSGYRIIAWLMALYFTKFFIIFIYLYSTTTNMHALNAITARIEGFGHISFPSKIDSHPSCCIISMSQLGSFRGSTAYTALYDMLTVNGISLFCVIGFKWYEYNNNGWEWNNHQHLSLIFGLTTAFGIWCAGTWELNHYSKIHKRMHYLGALGLLTVGVAISFQFNFSIFSIFLFAINLILWGVYYFVASFYFDPEYKDDAQKVHFVSMVSITLEVIAWILLAFTITFFVYNLH